MKSTGYCYHLVNVITFGLAQSDYIKRLPLYKKWDKYKIFNLTTDKIIDFHLICAQVHVNNECKKTVIF